MPQRLPWPFFILLLCCFSQTTKAASFFAIERFGLHESLDAFSETLLDGPEEAAAVLRLPATAWQPMKDTNRWHSKGSGVWIRTTIRNQLEVPAQLTLVLRTSLYTQVRFFVLEQMILREQSMTGPQTESFQHPLASMYPAHTLTLEPGAVRTVLVSVQSQPPRDLHWEIRDTESHLRESFQSTLRWTFLLATLMLLACMALAYGMAQKRSIPLALALVILLRMLFLVRVSHWPLLSMFWEPLSEVLPPAPHILCAAQAAMLLLLRRLSQGLEPQRLLQKFYWFALGFLVLDLSLVAVLHQNEALLFMIPGGIVILVLLFFLRRLMSQQKHQHTSMVTVLLGHQALWGLAQLAIIVGLLPLALLPEIALWMHALGSLVLVPMALFAARPAASLNAAAPLQETQARSHAKPDQPAHLLHEQWLHAEKMAALGTFTNGLANELNNPLAIVAGHRFRLSSMIESRSFNIHEFEKSLGKIDQAVNRMIAVIDALKVYSQDPQGQEIFKTFSVRETIKYTIDLCRDKVISRGIRLSTPELGDATMEGHQGQIIQVLLILVDNAIDALEHAADKTIRLELQPLPDSVRIAVIDSGPGVPLELRSKIWDPFVTSKDPFRHKGLGLSIASGIINNHRGRILLDESTPETRFVVELPRTRQPLIPS